MVIIEIEDEQRPGVFKRPAILTRDVLPIVFSYLTYKDLRRVRWVCKSWKQLVREQCLAQIQKTQLVNFDNSPQKYNEGYYKNVIYFAEGLGIDATPSGLIVLCAYASIPLAAYTVATVGTTGLLIRIGSLAWSFFRAHHLLTAPIATILTGQIPTATSIVGGYAYAQLCYSFPYAVKKMVVGWVRTIWRSGKLLISLVKDGVAGLINVACSLMVKEIRVDDQEWLLVDFPQKDELEYHEISPRRDEIVFALRKVRLDENHFGIDSFEMKQIEYPERKCIEYKNNFKKKQEEQEEYAKSIYPKFSLNENYFVNKL